jgi:hypothetical protein
LAAVLAVLFLIGHLPFLASTLEDVDSANFALGIRAFDPGRHRPHPPGYPIYMALAKSAAMVMDEPYALAIWGALVGALSAFSLLRFFACLDAIDGAQNEPPGGRFGFAAAWLSPPGLATMLVMTAPLVWMTASRPMSDTLGFAASMAAQAVLATAWLQQSRMRDVVTGRIDAAVATASGKLILTGALLCAIAIGVRSQATWLTVPLLLGVMIARRRREAVAALMGSAVWFIGGVLAWLVPLVLASGGPVKYLAAFASQAGEDWAGVDLLATHPTPRKLAFALYETFVLHWGNSLGWVMVGAALVGGTFVLMRRRRALWMLVLVSAPYCLFHLGFQETVTTRYALPLVPPVAYLAVRGLLWMLGPVAGRAALVVVACVGIALTAPVTARYARIGSPTTRVVADLTAAADSARGTRLGMHHAFARVVEAERAATPPWQTLPAPPKHEWLSLVKAWLAGERRPIWFLADPHRTDLALIDPLARTVQARYAWPFDTDVFLGGIRPNAVQWLIIGQPGWFAEEGWHLTPETAGLARAEKRGLEFGPLVAWVKRRDGDAVVLLGGRHLGEGAGPTARLDLTVDGRPVESWTVAPANDFFLRVVRLPAGSLVGDTMYAKLEIQSHATDGNARTGVAVIDQFDLQDAGVVMTGYDTGWNEAEHNPATGQTWRWASERAVLRATVVDRDCELLITGESPAKSFSKPSTVVVKAGDQVLHTSTVAADFAWSIPVPAAALAKSGGTITIASDQWFRPADRGQNADKRSLALRVFSARLTPASGPGTAASSRTASAPPAASSPQR